MALRATLASVSLVCDDLEAMAQFWQTAFGFPQRWRADPIDPERQLLQIDVGTGAVEYSFFAGQPGERGSGDLRRLDLAVDDPAGWASLADRLDRAGAATLGPRARLILDPAGLMIHVRGPV